MEELDAISSSSGSNDPYSDNDDQIPTGDGGGTGIHQENESKESRDEEEIKQDSVKEEKEEAKKTDEEIDLSKEAEEKTGDGGGGIHQENEAESREVETMRTDQLKGKGEIVKKMLEDVQDTDIEKKARNAAYFLAQKDIEKKMEICAKYLNTLNRILVRKEVELLTENEKKTLRQTQDQSSLHLKVLEKLLGLSKQEEKLVDAIAAEIADDQKQILQQQLSSLSSDTESARYQLHMVKKPFPKLMDETRKILGNMKKEINKQGLSKEAEENKILD